MAEGDAAGGDGGEIAVPGLPPGLPEEVETAVVDLIEGSPRRRAHRRRRT